MTPLGGFNWLDLGIFVLAVLSLAVGFAQGLLRQVIGLAALYIATILGAQYYVPFSNFIKGILFLQASNLLSAVSFFVILIAIWLLITWLAFDAYRATHIRIFPLIDQLGGSLIALITFGVTLILILPVVKFMIADPWANSENYRQALVFMMDSSRLVPELLKYRELVLSAIRPWMPYSIPAIFNL